MDSISTSITPYETTATMTNTLHNNYDLKMQMKRIKDNLLHFGRYFRVRYNFFNY